MALINMALQGKGGVGKSFVSSLLAQYYLEKKAKLACYDTDPVNRTFAGYKAFEAEIVRLGERADELNPRYFDALVEKIMTAEEDATVVIDNGASTFLPLLGYMVESQALEMITGAGHEVRLHTVLTGGQALNDTLQGFSQLLKYVPDVPVVVWLNEYFGRIESRNGDGEIQSFEQSGLYKRSKSRIHALVRLPEVRKETFGHDIEQMMRARLTFEEATQHLDFPLMARQRLKMSWKAIHGAMDQAVL
ncbi:transfer origin protein, TraL [Tepidicaulis marinus]|uniref:Transfer origin protein, TraL n=1 Tax=Tepidicaulis marinus TaxID=1333998 RepID=A0A081BFP5_9HYPH|nr:conjugal transfer protein TraL [Tepidicaulis marinus]GAK46863.1 transfer origin protein, TraL [Tepidicaulis marinus]